MVLADLMEEDSLATGRLDNVIRGRPDCPVGDEMGNRFRGEKCSSGLPKIGVVFEQHDAILPYACSNRATARCVSQGGCRVSEGVRDALPRGRLRTWPHGVWKAQIEPDAYALGLGKHPRCSRLENFPLRDARRVSEGSSDTHRWACCGGRQSTCLRTPETTVCDPCLTWFELFAHRRSSEAVSSETRFGRVNLAFAPAGSNE